MFIEYSHNQEGKRTSFCYVFDVFEKRVMISGIPKAIQILEKKINKIEKNPKNDGQVTYFFAIRELQIQIDCLKEIETEFLKDINDYNQNKKKKDQV